MLWVGGSHTLRYANPPNGHVLRTVTLPTDHNVVEYFGSPVISGGRAYSYYSDNASQQSGLVRMTPPAACTGRARPTCTRSGSARRSRRSARASTPT